MSLSAMVLFDRALENGCHELLTEFKRNFPNDPMENLDDNNSADFPMLVKIGVARYAVLLINASPPLGEFELVGRQSVRWPDAVSSLEHVNAHIIIHSFPQQERVSPIDIARGMTFLMGAACNLSGAVTGYWGAAEQLIHPQEVFQESIALYDGHWPLAVWLRISFLHSEERLAHRNTLISTHGLAVLIGREIVARTNNSDAERSWHIVLQLSAYLLTNGPVLKNGDTIGGISGQSIIVRTRAAGRGIDFATYVVDL